MIALLIILAALIGYLVVGLGVARLARPRLIADATHSKGDRFYAVLPGYTYTHGWQTRQEDGIDRRHVRRTTRALLLGWPVTLPMFVLNNSLDRAMDRADPQVHAKMAQRIKELERDLRL